MIVLDTSVVIDLFIGGDPTDAVIKRGDGGHYRRVSSPPLFEWPDA